MTSLYTMRGFSGGVRLEATWVTTTCCGSSGSVSETHDVAPIVFFFSLWFNFLIVSTASYLKNYENYCKINSFLHFKYLDLIKTQYGETC